MNEDRWWMPFAGAIVYIALRAVDYLLPTGRHWRFIERYSRPNKARDEADRRQRARGERDDDLDDHDDDLINDDR